MIRTIILAALSKPGAPTRAALARAAGLAPENLTHWLKERRPIPLAAAERLLAALDIEPEARREIGELREQIERCERRAKELLG